MCMSVYLCVCVWPCHMNPFRSFVPFCYRPLSLPLSLFANWHEQKNTPSHTPLTPMPTFSLLEWKLWPPKDGDIFVDRPTERAIELLAAAKKNRRGDSFFNLLFKQATFIYFECHCWHYFQDFWWEWMTGAFLTRSMSPVSQKSLWHNGAVKA